MTSHPTGLDVALAGLLVCLLLILLPVALIAGGSNLTIDGSGLHRSWDEITRIRETNQTERLRISEQNETERWAIFWGVAPWLLAIASAAGLGALWLLRRPAPRRPGPPPVAILIAARPLLRQQPDRRLEIIDGDWCVVDDAERAVYQLTDGTK